MVARRRILACVAAAVVAVAVGVALFGGDGGYVVRAEFRDAAGLHKDVYVKLDGVPAGHVTSLRLTKRDTAMVTMRLEDGAAPVGAGATATVRPVNLLGEKFVDLEPGDVRGPLASGSLIPLGRTAASVELDDVLDTLDDPTRALLHAFIQEAGVAMAGRGADFNRLLAEAPHALDRFGALLDQLAVDNRTLRSVVERSDRVVGSIARERAGLGHLVQNAGDALTTVASRRRRLGETLREAPSTLRQARMSLALLQRNARALGPAAAQLRTAAPALEAALRTLPTFQAQGRPALAALRQAAPTLTRLGTQATPVVQRLHPTAQALADFSESLDPVTDLLDPTGIRDLLGVLEGWSRAIQGRDGLSHRFRNDVQLGPDALRDLLAAYAALSPPTARHRAGLPTPVDVLRSPAARVNPRELTDRLADKVHRLGDRLSKQVGGQAPGNVQILLDHLLGK